MSEVGKIGWKAVYSTMKCCDFDSVEGDRLHRYLCNNKRCKPMSKCSEKASPCVMLFHTLLSVR